MTGSPFLIASPISLPERRIGNFAIQYHTFLPFIPVMLLDHREAFLTGRKPVTVTFNEPLRIHELVQFDQGGKRERVWMSDEPRELRQAMEAIEGARPRGRVLVGGLGLGIVSRWMAAWPGVRAVDVVELSPEVVQLVYDEHQRGLYRVVVADILAFIRSVRSWPYDLAFLDTWQGTGEAEWWETVFPLRRAIANRFGKQRVVCWAENIMLGQVIKAIHEGNVSHGPLAGRHWFYEGLPPEMSETDALWFVSNVGLPAWEKRYGALYRREE